MFEPKLFLPDDYDKHVSGWFKIYLFSFQVSDDCVIASDLDWWLLRTRYVGLNGWFTNGYLYIFFSIFILFFILFEWMCRCRVVHNVGVWLLIRFDVCRSEIVICGRGRLCSLRAIGERLSSVCERVILHFVVLWKNGFVCWAMLYDDIFPFNFSPDIIPQMRSIRYMAAVFFM